jgi:hypothetical protein
MADRDDVWADYVHSTKTSDTADGEAWFWITLTLACLPWLVALAVWRS